MRFVGFVGAWIVGAVVGVGACKHHDGVENAVVNPADPAWADVFVPSLPDLAEATDGGCAPTAESPAGTCSGAGCRCAQRSCAFACSPDVADAG